jgi:uncharacterized cupin superfamily protein
VATQLLSSPWFFLSVGALVTVALQGGARAARYAGVEHPNLPVMAEDKPAPLKPMSVDESWIIEGSPRFFASEYFSSLDGHTVSGIWVCEGPGKFRWRHDTDEALFVLEGFAYVEYDGVTHTLAPGDVTFFHAGTTTTWSVPERIRKTFTLNEPGGLRRWLRRSL